MQMSEEHIFALVKQVDTFLTDVMRENELQALDLASLVVSRLAVVNKTYGNPKEFAEFLALVAVNLE